MSTTFFLVSIGIAVLGPIAAVTYLRPILYKILHGLCGGDGGAEFWIRSAYVLAVCGTLLLMLMFGDFSAQSDLTETLRRALILVFTGIFVTVTIISRNVWRGVQRMLDGTSTPPAVRATPTELRP